MANKPTTLGYFIRRMVNSGYAVERVFADYADTDSRAWTVVIDPRGASVFCTCFTNRNELGDNYFEFYDGGQFLPNCKIKTESIEVLIRHLEESNVRINEES